MADQVIIALSVLLFIDQQKGRNDDPTVHSLIIE